MEIPRTEIRLEANIHNLNGKRAAAALINLNTYKTGILRRNKYSLHQRFNDKLTSHYNSTISTLEPGETTKERPLIS